MVRPRIPLYYRDHPRAKYRIIERQAADIGRPSCSITKKHLSGRYHVKHISANRSRPLTIFDYFQHLLAPMSVAMPATPG
jgi:hypothetical protein